MKKFTPERAARYLGELVSMFGFTWFQKNSCGCVFCTTGDDTDLDLICKRHRARIPRTCPCGHIDDLTSQTHQAHTVRDLETVERLRKERIQHWEQCRKGAAA